MRNLTARSGNKDERANPPGECLALLGALCLFLSTLDHLIPKPLPFMRIGLANLPLLAALDFLPAADFFTLVFIKILGQALVTGTLFSYVVFFSASGTVLSALTMFVLRRSAGSGTARVSLIGTSIAGAFVSNAAQLLLARFIVFGEGILYLAPPFLAAGIVSGGLLGLFAEQFSVQSQWLRWMRERSDAAKTGTPADAASGKPPEHAPRAAPEHSARSGPAIQFRRGGLFALAVFFLLVPNLFIRTALFLLFWIFAAFSEKKTRPFFIVTSFAAITVCNLFPPFGKILVNAGPFTIAQGSLLRGLQRAVTMEGLIMFSHIALLSIPRLPGKIGKLIGESFVILDRMDELFFAKAKRDSGKNRQIRREGQRRKSPAGYTNKHFLKKLDMLLCEVSGCAPRLD